MVKKEKIKEAIVEQHYRDLPLMDIEEVKKELLQWLEELKLSPTSESMDWEGRIKVCPADAVDHELDSGTRVRLSLRLDTQKNRYLISIMESLNIYSRENYILSLHVNWNETERQMQRMVDQAYTGGFADTLKAKHVLWAQTFRMGGLSEALNHCAAAILGNELTAETTTEDHDRTPTLSVFPTVKVGFPRQDDI